MILKYDTLLYRSSRSTQDFMSENPVQWGTRDGWPEMSNYSSRVEKKLPERRLPLAISTFTNHLIQTRKILTQREFADAYMQEHKSIFSQLSDHDRKCIWVRAARCFYPSCVQSLQGYALLVENHGGFSAVYWDVQEDASKGHDVTCLVADYYRINVQLKGVRNPNRLFWDDVRRKSPSFDANAIIVELPTLHDRPNTFGNLSWYHVSDFHKVFELRERYLRQISGDLFSSL